jgi:ribonuclease Z
MKIIFYGTTGAVPTKENTNVSFSVIAGECSILVDASGNPAHQLMKADINPVNLDILILTHAHPDHIYAFPSLIHNLGLMKREKVLHIITNPPTATKAKQLCEVFSLFTEEELFPVEWSTLEEGVVDILPGVAIKLFPVKHSISNSGVKITTAAASLVYSSDTAPSERVIQEANGAKALIHEASGSGPHEKNLNGVGHSSARQAGEVAEKAGVDVLYLCHFDARQAISLNTLQDEAQKVFTGKVVIPELFTSYEV